MSAKTFLLMAGGTGGHIFPALAVASSLKKMGHNVVWLGSKDSMEERLVPQHDIHLETIAMKGVRGNGLKRKLMLPMMLYRAVQDVREIIRRQRIDAVIGFGGFVTFPGGVAAKLSGIPLIIHEQNAVAGMSNKYLAKWANRVLYAFPSAFDNYPNGLVGNPVRADIVNLPEPKQRVNFSNLNNSDNSEKLTISVIGGSLGAQVLNDLVPEAIALLPESKRQNIHIIHQSGRGRLENLQQNYQKYQENQQIKCMEFVDDMVSIYRDSDLLICRAGALTIAELTAAGVGALLVPYPHAVDNHQTANARFMVSAEAGLLLPQSELTAQKLADILSGLTKEQCLKWAENARTLALPNSADDVAKIAIQVVENK